MVNFRYHVLSIAAVFLALAAGLAIGAGLLSRTTEDSLKSTQARIESRLEQFRAQNDAFRAALADRDAVSEDALQGPVRAALAGSVRSQVLLVPARGISTVALAAVQADIVAAGGTVSGVLWWETTATMADPAAVIRLATALKLPADTAATTAASALLSNLADGVLPLSDAPVSPLRGNQTTTTLASFQAPAGSIEAANSLLRMLTDTGAVSFTPAPGNRVAQLDARPLRIVVVGGEGASPAQNTQLAGFVGELTARQPGAVVACEIMEPRSTVEQVEASLRPKPILRGIFVDPIRANGDTSGRLTTIDALDTPTGRLALLLTLRGAPLATPGAYGVSPSATAPFPAYT
jgi:hypothetical protein